MTSYYNRHLHIDLGVGAWSTSDLPEEVLARYAGGKGVAACLLAARQDPHAKPFGCSTSSRG